MVSKKPIAQRLQKEGQPVKKWPARQATVRLTGLKPKFKRLRKGPRTEVKEGA